MKAKLDKLFFHALIFLLEDKNIWQLLPKLPYYSLSMNTAFSAFSVITSLGDKMVYQDVWSNDNCLERDNFVNIMMQNPQKSEFLLHALTELAKSQASAELSKVIIKLLFYIGYKNDSTKNMFRFNSLINEVCF